MNALVLQNLPVHDPSGLVIVGEQVHYHCIENGVRGGICCCLRCCIYVSGGIRFPSPTPLRNRNLRVASSVDMLSLFKLSRGRGQDIVVVCDPDIKGRQ
jgi:hypothetical protein